MKNKFYFPILFSLIILFSCSKEEDSASSINIPVGSGGASAHTTFVFTGSMQVDKNDSNWVHISNYAVPNTTSKMIKETSNYTLSTNFDATVLKGEVIHSIPVEIPTHYFSAYSGGVGIFEIGVIDGYFDNDSLYYHVLYQDADSNNIYLDFTGLLTDSY